MSSDSHPVVAQQLQVGKFSCNCSYCRRDISQTLRIKCAECEAFVLCGDCFSVGVELYPHKNTHAYTVNDCLETPVFTKDWTLAEEFLLLDGIAKLGLGNWRMVGEYIGQRTARQCEEHYWEQYMGCYGTCLPPHFISNGITTPTQALISSDCSPYLCVPAGCVAGDRVIRGEVSVSGPSGRGSNSASQRKEQELREKLAQLPGADLAGFMPLREDFDVEYENDAEKLLADMEFTADEHESETMLKLRVVQIYNQKLAERERRKRFAIDRGLVDLKRQLQSEKRRNKEDREATLRLRSFARLQTAEENDAMLEGVMQARRLKKQLEVLQSYRSLGLRNVEEAREFEAERKRKEHEVRSARQKGALSNNSNEISGIAAGRRSSSSTPRAAALASIDDKFEHYRGEVVNRRRSARASETAADQQPSAKLARIDGNNAQHRVPSDATLAITFASAVSSVTEGAVSPLAAEYDVITDERGAAVALDASPDRNITIPEEEFMDIIDDTTALPNISDAEVRLCAQLGLSKSEYASLKAELVKDIYRTGTLTADGIKKHFQPSQQGEMVYDYFVECGLQHKQK